MYCEEGCQNHIRDPFSLVDIDLRISPTFLDLIDRMRKMRYYRQVPLALLTGAVTGAFVLGIAGRMATAVIALITGHAPNLSLSGGLEAVVVGTLVGAVGGIPLLAVRSVHSRSKLVRGTTVGGMLFICSGLGASIFGKITLGVSSVQLVMLGIVAIMFIVYGICADTLLTRFACAAVERDGPDKRENPG